MDAVEVDRALFFGIVVGLGALVGLLAIGWLLSRRAAVRRLAAAALRLEAETTDREPRGLEKNLARLERAVEHAVERGGEAEMASVRLANALEAIPQGVVVCDDTGAVVHRNDVATQFLQARHGDAVVGLAIEQMLQAALDGQPEKRTLEVYGPPRRTVVIAALPLDDHRRTIGALAVIDDVSERRRLEAVRRDFVANISHELKTPVGALGLLAETLLAEDDPGVARRLAERMLTEAFRVGRTIEDLLDLSRIEAEEAPRREPVPVHLVVAEAVERIRPAAEQQIIDVRVDEPDRHLSVVGDRRQLVSALANLLDNAVKYSEKGSTVTVSGAVHDHDVHIAVSDQGVGIPDRDLERIFERFYRVDRGRSRDTGGTGLGLAIVRHVASNHDGDVRVTSREGEGSTFTLVLPALES